MNYKSLLLSTLVIASGASIVLCEPDLSNTDVYRKEQIKLLSQIIDNLKNKSKQEIENGIPECKDENGNVSRPCISLKQLADNRIQTAVYDLYGELLLTRGAKKCYKQNKELRKRVFYILYKQAFFDVSLWSFYPFSLQSPHKTDLRFPIIYNHNENLYTVQGVYSVYTHNISLYPLSLLLPYLTSLSYPL